MKMSAILMLGSQVGRVATQGVIQADQRGVRSIRPWSKASRALRRSDSASAR